VESMRYIKSDIPAGMSVPEYKRLLNRPRRHSAIRRLVGFGTVR
jgi:hypothetical protein